MDRVIHDHFTMRIPLHDADRIREKARQAGVAPSKYIAEIVLSAIRCESPQVASSA